MVTLAGFEPATKGLKVPCATIAPEGRENRVTAGYAGLGTQ